MSFNLAMRAPAPQSEDHLRICDRPSPAAAQRRRRLAGAARVLGATVLLASGLLTAAAPGTMAYGTALSCTGRSLVQYYKPWGDANNYFRVSNGGFESGATDWQMSGSAAVVAGNETYRVAGSGDAKSLRLGSGASAESRTLCVSMGEDKLRLFANNPKVMGALLHVDVVVRNPSTNVRGYFAWDRNADAWPSGWQPTPTLTIPNVFNGSSTEEVTVTLSTRGSAATWYVARAG